MYEVSTLQSIRGILIVVSNHQLFALSRNKSHPFQLMLIPGSFYLFLPFIFTI